MEWVNKKAIPASPSTEQAIEICTKLNLSFSKTRYEMRLKEEEMAKKGYCILDKEKLQETVNKFLQPFGHWVQITNDGSDGIAVSLKTLSAIEHFILPPLVILFFSSVVVLAFDFIVGNSYVFPALCLSIFLGAVSVFMIVVNGRISESKEKKFIVRPLDGACFIPPEILPLLEKASGDFERKEIFCTFDNCTDPFHVGLLFARSQQIVNEQERQMDFFIGGWCERGKKVWVMPTKI